MTKLFSTRNIARMAALSALAFVLQFFSFPILPYAGFLKVDFADVPVILGGFAIGMPAGMIIALVKNLLQLPFSSTGMIGELSNFCQGVTFVLVSTMIYRKWHTFVGAIVGMAVAVVSVTIVGCFTNYFIMLPAFMSGISHEVKMNLIWTAIIPFNLIKFALQSTAVLLLYKRLRFILKDSHQPQQDSQPTAQEE